jgi:alpha-tubulin suppressor-like RCC1 family protein
MKLEFITGYLAENQRNTGSLEILYDFSGISGFFVPNRLYDNEVQFSNIIGGFQVNKEYYPGIFVSCYQETGFTGSGIFEGVNSLKVLNNLSGDNISLFYNFGRLSCNKDFSLIGNNYSKQINTPTGKIQILSYIESKNQINPFEIILGLNDAYKLTLEFSGKISGSQEEKYNLVNYSELAFENIGAIRVNSKNLEFGYFDIIENEINNNIINLTGSYFNQEKNIYIGNMPTGKYRDGYTGFIGIVDDFIGFNEYFDLNISAEISKLFTKTGEEFIETTITGISYNIITSGFLNPTGILGTGITGYEIVPSQEIINPSCGDTCVVYVKSGITGVITGEKIEYIVTDAIYLNNSLFTWGLNIVGQLGLNNTGDREVFPVQVGNKLFKDVSCGRTFTLAIDDNYSIFSWGGNTDGQLGLNDVVSRSSPVQVGTSSWTSVSCGNSHTAAIRSDNALFTWGTNGFGQLGLNNTTSRSSPVQVGTSSWTSVSCGSSHTAAIRSDNALFVWGNNSNGRLGLNDTTSRSSPVQVGTSSWTSVSCGNQHTAAIRSDGALFAWGFNLVGQLGLNNTTTRSSPVQIGTSSWTSVSCGNTHTVAIRSDNALFTWGQNNQGQLGLNDVVSRSSPVQVGTSSWTSIDSAETNNMAIRNDNALFAWGSNSNNSLGFNDLVPRSSPAQVGSRSWNKFSLGAFHVAGIYKNIYITTQKIKNNLYDQDYASKFTKNYIVFSSKLDTGDFFNINLYKDLNSIVDYPNYSLLDKIYIADNDLTQKNTLIFFNGVNINSNEYEISASENRFKISKYDKTQNDLVLYALSSENNFNDKIYIGNENLALTGISSDNFNLFLNGQKLISGYNYTGYISGGSTQAVDFINIPITSSDVIYVKEDNYIVSLTGSNIKTYNSNLNYNNEKIWKNGIFQNKNENYILTSCTNEMMIATGDIEVKTQSIFNNEYYRFNI